MIEEVFGSKSKVKVVRRLAAYDDWCFNLSELGKETGLNKGSISKIIREFEAKDLLDVKHSGKLLMLKLKKHHQEALKKIFEIEKRWRK